jgi:hypothetical protein
VVISSYLFVWAVVCIVLFVRTSFGGIIGMAFTRCLGSFVYLLCVDIVRLGFGIRAHLVRCELISFTRAFFVLCLRVAANRQRVMER